MSKDELFGILAMIIVAPRMNDTVAIVLSAVCIIAMIVYRNIEIK